MRKDTPMPSNPDFARVVDDPCDKHALVLMVNGEGIHWADKSEFNRESLVALAGKINLAFQSELDKRVQEAVCKMAKALNEVKKYHGQFLPEDFADELLGALAEWEAIRSRKGKGDGNG